MATSQLAGELDADGVHLPAAQLLQLADRPDLPLIGASCHDRDELDRAASLGADFVVLGPVRPTPTHAHQPGLGWPAFSRLAAGLPMPVFALGGLGREHRDAARAAGAHGVAAIRTAWN